MFYRAFPKTYYSFDFKNDSPIAVTNIFTRIKLKSEIMDNVYAFYKYQIEDGDTPELVSYKQYGNPAYHWIVCLVNNLVDPHFDFPLKTQDLENKIIKQYGYNNISESFADIHHYELEVEETLSEVNGPTTVKKTDHIVTLEQYSYSANSIINNVPNTPTYNNAIFRANNSDPTSAIVATLSVKSTYKPVYVFDYENELNESKREIKLLKQEYISRVTAELETILNA
jgi:hypothetical protein